MKEILEDIGNLEKDYKKLQQEDIHSMTHLKQQTQQLQTEKGNLQQKKVLLENQISAIESDVGNDWRINLQIKFK